ncbi:hypothetical protein ACSBR1_019911 [Camellia fascicularis]
MNAAILAHIMQRNFILKSVSNTIDKLNRGFLWGSSSDLRKIHGVAWDTVTKPKNLGGLGIRQTCLVNKVSMAKLNWRLPSESNSLWAQTLKSKYGTITRVCNKASSVWRSLGKGTALLEKGSKMLLKNVLVVSPLLGSILVMIFVFGNTLLMVWAIPTNLRILHFVWRALHLKLNTKTQLFRRQIFEDDLYPICHCFPETIEHALRDCQSAAHCWSSIGIPTKAISTFSLDLRSWFKLNCQSLEVHLSSVIWATLFPFVCWSIWLLRNFVCFQNNLTLFQSCAGGC